MSDYESVSKEIENMKSGYYSRHRDLDCVPLLLARTDFLTQLNKSLELIQKIAPVVIMNESDMAYAKAMGCIAEAIALLCTFSVTIEEGK